ncbi:glycogen debranching protein GlgX [Salmonella enterica subsp. enterica]|uniref:Glycogen debranching protein GlgX n=1 Tax=Salmonella enterica I TaxID=59201 RepID=A0A379WUM6_SALET|nr:glycogen debranching protein GlgX [Salmonella enterica subsp. enterica]
MINTAIRCANIGKVTTSQMISPHACWVPAISMICAAVAPGQALNFITAHDGFTLNDLVSYNDKHNEANGEDNNDGHNDNRSCNYGAEGPTDDEGINAIREQQNVISDHLAFLARYANVISGR